MNTPGENFKDVCIISKF